MTIDKDQLERGMRIYERVQIGTRKDGAPEYKYKPGKVLQVMKSTASVQVDSEPHPRPIVFARLMTEEMVATAQGRDSAPPPAPKPAPPPPRVVALVPAPVRETLPSPTPLPQRRVEPATARPVAASGEAGEELRAWLEMGQGMRGKLEQRTSALRTEIDELEAEIQSLEQECKRKRQELSEHARAITVIDDASGRIDRAKEGL